MSFTSAHNYQALINCIWRWQVNKCFTATTAFHTRKQLCRNKVSLELHWTTCNASSVISNTRSKCPPLVFLHIFSDLAGLLTLWDTRCCHMVTAIKHPVPDRVKQSFVIFDIWTFWHSTMSVMLSPERQSARMTKITNDCSTQSGSQRINILVSPVTSSFRSSATLPESQSSVLDAQCY